MTSAPFKKGDLIRRLMHGNANDSRLFRVSFVNAKALNGGVFTALSADGHYMDWGGTFPKQHEFEIVKETK